MTVDPVVPPRRDCVSGSANAVSGDDFLPVAGTPFWPANDPGPRTITMRLVDDRIVEATGHLRSR